MATKIVFLNLADMHDKGLAKTTVDALRRKYPRYTWMYEAWAGANRIDLIDLFQLLDEQRNPHHINTRSRGGHWAVADRLSEIQRIKQLCADATKIMLGAHGHFDDQEAGYAGLGWDRGSGLVGTYREFAKLVSTFLLPNRVYRIALVVCFGARSANYRKNHKTGALDLTDLTSSFAFKFFHELVRLTRGDITVTARTGSVSFDPSTGKSLVQTEAAVSADIELKELETSERMRVLGEEYERVQEEMGNSGRIREFNDIVERMSAPDARPANDVERTIFDFRAARTRNNLLQSVSSRQVSKYGKFTYVARNGYFSIFRDKQLLHYGDRLF